MGMEVMEGLPTSRVQFACYTAAISLVDHHQSTSQPIPASNRQHDEDARTRTYRISFLPHTSRQHLSILPSKRDIKARAGQRKRTSSESGSICFSYGVDPQYLHSSKLAHKGEQVFDRVVLSQALCTQAGI